MGVFDGTFLPFTLSSHFPVLPSPKFHFQCNSSIGCTELFIMLKWVIEWGLECDVY